MNDSFNDLLKIAANLEFEKECSQAVEVDSMQHNEVNLSREQLQILSEKILLLPREGILILFCKYCFHFTPEEAELFYHIKDGKALLLYYKKWLSYIIGIDNKEMISESNFKDASVMAMKKYLDHELYEATPPLILKKSIKKRVLRKIAVAAVIAAVTFSTALVANAEFRERVVSWFIETFEKYTIFELKSSDGLQIQELQDFSPQYLPDKFELLDTIEQPSLILYEYERGDDEFLNVLISLSDTKVYVDTEGSLLETVQIEGVSGYYFKKDGNNYVIFEKNGYYFSVYGTIDKSELIRVAENIK
ncbi:DUF4367 domain-containing protein [Pseudoflavonifractor sp. P01025]|uniref:DUF4367 domain-containing protein n=1 Tax=Eubacteriales TaxID=186802 RepID=UPI001AE070F9